MAIFALGEDNPKSSQASSVFDWNEGNQSDEQNENNAEDAEVGSVGERNAEQASTD